MPALVPPIPDECDQLLAYLDQQRDALRCAAYGLTDEQVRETPTASGFCLGSLIRHVIYTEQNWTRMIRGEARGSSEAYQKSFAFRPDESLESVLTAYEQTAAETDELVKGIEDLDQPVPIPKGLPWFPSDVDAWTVRWVLLHMIEETARHAGHADIIRESIDGATAIPLMAAAEHWPPGQWIKPWEPAHKP